MTTHLFWSILACCSLAVARTITLDPSVTYIKVGSGASCDNVPAPVHGSPRICLGPSSALMMGSMHITQLVDGTTVFSLDGKTVAAFGTQGAISVGSDIALGTPGSVTVVPQNMYGVIDRIWAIGTQLAIINAKIQTVTLIGTSMAGINQSIHQSYVYCCARLSATCFNCLARYCDDLSCCVLVVCMLGVRVRSDLDNSSVVLLNGGQVVVDNNSISRSVVLAGIRAGATVVTQGSVFSPNRDDVPIVFTVPIPADGQIRLQLTMYSDPSVCGNALARQTVTTTIGTLACTALTSDLRFAVEAATNTSTDPYAGIIFAQCPDVETNLAAAWINATIYTSVDCSADGDPILIPLGTCIASRATMGCQHAT